MGDGRACGGGAVGGAVVGGPRNCCEYGRGAVTWQMTGFRARGVYVAPFPFGAAWFPAISFSLTWVTLMFPVRGSAQSIFDSPRLFRSR